MKRSGWIASLLLLVVTAVTMVLAGDALAGDKKGKKDKEDKKDKKNEKVIDVKERGSKKGETVDPTRPKKDAGKKGSGVKGQGSKGNGSKSEARSRSRSQSRKRSCKRSSGGKK